MTFYVVALLFGQCLQAQDSVKPSKKSHTGHTERMESIYAALKLKNVRLDGDSHRVGDRVRITYELVNTSREKLQVPGGTSGSRTALIGARQHWIERLDDVRRVNVGRHFDMIVAAWRSKAARSSSVGAGGLSSAEKNAA